MKEIVTLQVGGFGNFVGSHFWNFQDEILGLAELGYDDPSIPIVGLNMDVLYKVGETRLGRPTYTPRLLSLDLRGSSGAVSPAGTLYEPPPRAEPSSVTTWRGHIATFRSEPHEKNKFLQSLDEEEEEWTNSSVEEERAQADSACRSDQNGEPDVLMSETNDKERALVQSLENEVQYWTDFLKTHLHPSSVYQIPGLWHGVTPFEDYGSGQGVLSGEEQAEELRNRVRLFVEECDHMQGFQFLVDDSGGFSSVAADLLDDVVEEYEKTPIFLFTLRPPEESTGPRGSLVRNLHDAVSLARLASVAHLNVPLGLPRLADSAFAEHLLIQDKKQFHSSAVCAVAINSITLPFRMEVSGPSVTSQVAGVGSTDMGSALRLVSCGSARRVAQMEGAFPAPAVPDSRTGQAYKLQKLSPLSPSMGKDTSGNEVAELLVVQGGRLTGSRGPATVSQVQESLARNNEKLVRMGSSPRRGLILNHLAISPCPLAIPLPFPCIFSPYIGTNGDILSSPVVSSHHGRGGLDVVSAPVTTRMRTSGVVIPYIKKRCEDIDQLGLTQSTAGPSLLEDWGFSREEVEELRETLCRMLYAYGNVTPTDSSDTE